MRTILKYVAVACFAFLAASGVAWGAPALQRLKQFFTGGIAIGTASQVATSSNVISGAFVPATCNYNFPPLSNTVGGEQVCADSFACSAPGAAVGDACAIGDTAFLDAGTAILESRLSCYVSASGSVKVRACAHVTDGGVIDIPDAGYRPRVISNQ